MRRIGMVGVRRKWWRVPGFIVAMAGAMAWGEEVDLHGPQRLTVPELEAVEAVQVRDRAGSMEELAKKTGAAATWGGRNLLWVKEDGDGKVKAFAVDQAYELKDGTKSQWVTLKVEGNVGPSVGWQEILYSRRRVEMDKKVGKPGEVFARRLLSDERKGEVYEVIWRSLVEDGQGCFECERYVVVMREAGKGWRVLGELTEGGPWCCGGRTNNYEQLKLKARWGADGALKLELEKRVMTWEVRGMEDEDRSVETVEHGTADGEGLMVKWEGKKYLVSSKGDTVQKVARHLAYWSSGGFRDADEREKRVRAAMEKRWVEAILRANPGLEEGKIGKGVKVVVPRDEGIERMAESLRNEVLGGVE
jgi:hypothetical protein